MNRRTLIGALGAAAAGAAVGRAGAAPVGGIRAGHRPRPPYFLDAMGEIRLTHTRDVLREVIASGTRMVTVTVTDPRVYGESALDAALDDLVAHDRHIAATSDLLLKATSVSDIDRAVESNRIALFYLFQNTNALHKDVGRVDMLHGLGVRSLQMTYNFQNYVGSGCQERGDGGLTHFGREVVARMNEIGMLVDASHANMATMADAIRASTAPTIISHTGCAALHDHVRNTTDDNLRLLADHGGVVGICQIRPFLTDDRSDDNVRFYLDHLEHAVRVAGEDHVCIGSDRDHRVIEDDPAELEQLRIELGAQFDEADWPLYMPALNGPRRMEVVHDGLTARGWPAARIDKVMRGNLRRLYAEVIG